MSLKVVIVGAVALGPKAACRIKRLRPDAEITMIDQETFFSYGGCGMPYYLSEDVLTRPPFGPPAFTPFVTRNSSRRRKE